MDALAVKQAVRYAKAHALKQGPMVRHCNRCQLDAHASVRSNRFGWGFVSRCLRWTRIATTATPCRTPAARTAQGMRSAACGRWGPQREGHGNQTDASDAHLGPDPDPDLDPDLDPGSSPDSVSGSDSVPDPVFDSGSGSGSGSGSLADLQG